MTKTIGDLVDTAVHTIMDHPVQATCDFIGNHKTSITIAALGLTVLSAYHGFVDRIPPEYLSHPNFIKPGSDLKWEFEATGYGILFSAIGYTYEHLRQYAVVMVAAPFVGSLLNRIGSIQISQTDTPASLPHSGRLSDRSDKE